jgi:aspartate aminotransferase
MGGFYLFVSAEPKRKMLERRGIKDSATLAEIMLEEIGVAVLPGSDFGRPAGEFTFRLAFVDFDGEQALHLIDSNLESEDFINRCCQDIKIGIEQLNNYFN